MGESCHWQYLANAKPGLVRGIGYNVHAADLDHPVIRRGAEQAYLPRSTREPRRSGVRRPWSVYGTNTYTPRLQQILES